MADSLISLAHSRRRQRRTADAGAFLGIFFWGTADRCSAPAASAAAQLNQVASKWVFVHPQFRGAKYPVGSSSNDHRAFEGPSAGPLRLACAPFAQIPTGSFVPVGFRFCLSTTAGTCALPLIARRTKLDSILRARIAAPVSTMRRPHDRH